MRAVFDENLAPALPKALAATIPDHEFAHVFEITGRGATDEAIFATLQADPESVLVTQDRRQTRNPHIKAALRASGVTVVFLARAWSDLDNVMRLSRLCLWWPYIEGAIRTNARGSWFEVPQSTRVGQLRPIAATRAEIGRKAKRRRRPKSRRRGG